MTEVAAAQAGVIEAEMAGALAIFTVIQISTSTRTSATSKTGLLQRFKKLRTCLPELQNEINGLSVEVSARTEAAFSLVMRTLLAWASTKFDQVHLAYVPEVRSP